MALNLVFVLCLGFLQLHLGSCGKCITDCKGSADGTFQWCESCKSFVSCSNGMTFVIPCPASLEWDDNQKLCVKHSDTCPVIYGFHRMAEEVKMFEKTKNVDFPPQRHCNSTGPKCVKNCTGVKDGDYQSCHGCDVYVSCVAGLRYDDRPCAPGGLVWDDNKKRCEWTSDTCHGCDHPNPCKGTGPCCKTGCKGLRNGDYQSCHGCKIFMTCSNGLVYDRRPCAPNGTVWDDNKKLCSWVSNTCFECP